MVMSKLAIIVAFLCVVLSIKILVRREASVMIAGQFTLISALYLFHNITDILHINRAYYAWSGFLATTMILVLVIHIAYINYVHEKKMKKEK